MTFLRLKLYEHRRFCCAIVIQSLYYRYYILDIQGTSIMWYMQHFSYSDGSRFRRGCPPRSVFFLGLGTELNWKYLPGRYDSMTSLDSWAEAKRNGFERRRDGLRCCRRSKKTLRADVPSGGKAIFFFLGRVWSLYSFDELAVENYDVLYVVRACHAVRHLLTTSVTL